LIPNESMVGLLFLTILGDGGVERGERNVAALNLIRIAMVLKVEIGQLFPSIKKLQKL